MQYYRDRGKSEFFNKAIEGNNTCLHSDENLSVIRPVTE